MKQKLVQHFVLGVITAYGFAALVFVSSAKLGVIPVQADVAPSRLEASLLGWALHTSVTRRAPAAGNPLPLSDENLIAGARLYREMCARCHSVSEESDNSYGRWFYPPAPNWANTGTSYTESEIFWIVKHGIRNTAMPGWGRLLSDDEIWRIVTFMRKPDSLPDSVTGELFGRGIVRKSAP